MNMNSLLSVALQMTEGEKEIAKAVLWELKQSKVIRCANAEGQ
ncbi:hypothetical protein Psal006b_00947 [Piscirickettsia salmonis]|uniref:Uncharacterized protein n=1 Tax=Piscirickettsia salmonis TaxID=1238 RepID=A0AAC8VJK6_PISSA|nr:hypothetical protein KU39_2256 [Piscirickettsia salmonis]QGN97964.1 hypothetical protein Psal006b_00947 [Piscirickettsia salmonis]QGO01575.1 hypothetical protein Psal008_00956 [Piscirickettsia salmonis]QGO12277.1 hypothetical protein Psal010b_00948 [Piscirickettsia salmonis]QGO19310.1 hypothetical protein Psal013_00953 [Piscirickettsia salmonis]